MAKIHDFDARGVWRLWILQKVSIKCLIPHFSCRAWKYESNGGLVEGLSAILAEKNESSTYENQRFMPKPEVMRH